jgi:hypothetical protein
MFLFLAPQMVSKVELFQPFQSKFLESTLPIETDRWTIFETLVKSQKVLIFALILPHYGILKKTGTLIPNLHQVYDTRLADTKQMLHQKLLMTIAKIIKT